MPLFCSFFLFVVLCVFGYLAVFAKVSLFARCFAIIPMMSGGSLASSIMVVEDLKSLVGRHSVTYLIFVGIVASTVMWYTSLNLLSIPTLTDVDTCRITYFDAAKEVTVWVLPTKFIFHSLTHECYCVMDYGCRKWKLFDLVCFHNAKICFHIQHSKSRS